MKKFFVLVFVAVLLVTLVPTAASARGGNFAPCLLGALGGILVGSALSAPPPVYEAPPPAYGMCWAFIPEHWERRWDMYRQMPIDVLISAHQQQIPCR